MTSCCIEDCGNPNCAVCRWARTPPTPRCTRWVDGQQCRFIETHPPPCKPPYGARRPRKVDTRDGTAKPKGPTLLE